MTKTKPTTPDVKKKEYVKPKLTEVRLVAEEAVLGDCKFGNNVFGCDLNLCDNVAGS